ncbi:hypothetical protein [Ferruginibacter sp. HRS2-29]|uniref:hypothetical protein n=1 Tax=Ferruginibacter sp. HRS2-29 TaxID=2487334 RepID=UPI0020CD917D|nr:hypothetical protein [Ferruginibacter sp. HRS2-29]MCP9751616.1 hypothetical protein [Ferruginibacter sp. HRS2-29]MCP9753077.1 hypothetical protein [Ferruginibacter sp. HRS2-29]
MKKLIFALALMVFSNAVLAQLSITTNYRQDGIWDAKNEKWNVTSTDKGATTLEFDKKLSMFEHTTPTISSHYDILEYKYDENANSYTMKVKSDAGNEYEMIIDGKNNCVVFFYWYNKEYVMVRHTINETWIRK